MTKSILGTVFVIILLKMFMQLLRHNKKQIIPEF